MDLILEQTVAENAWQVDAGLYRILLPAPVPMVFVNAFVAESRGQFMLVDCGVNWEPGLRALGRALKAIGVPDRGLTYLVLTHRHVDHAGAAGPVQVRWGGQTLLHPRGLDLPAPTPEAVSDWLISQGVPAALAPPTAPKRRPEALPEHIDPLRTDSPLRLGDLSFHIIPVPGHAPDQVMLHEPQRGWLLVADQILPAPAPNVWLFPGSGSDPLRDYLVSLERTAAIAADLVLPSHGMPRRGGLYEAAAAMAGYHHRLAARVRRAMQGRRWTAWELLRLMHPQVESDPQAIFWRLGETLAALSYLAGRGEVVRTAGGFWEEHTEQHGAGGS